MPFVNDQDEFLALRGHLGLTGDTPLAVFVETPAAVHSTPGFCAAGASELFVGTKDLTQFYLAADRSNHLVAASYQTRHPAVMAGLRQVVASARHAGTPVHVFALLADLEHYVDQLPADGFMMCTAELGQLVRPSGEAPLREHRPRVDVELTGVAIRASPVHVRALPPANGGYGHRLVFHGAGRAFLVRQAVEVAAGESDLVACRLRVGM